MRLLAFVAVLLTAATALAENPFLPAAKRLYESVEYDAALEQLNRARGFQGTTAPELVDIEVYTGLVKFELGDADGARLAFRTALSLDPKAQLPAEVSPKVHAEWTSIQQEIAKMKVPEPQKKPEPAAPPVEKPAPTVATAPSVPPPAPDLTPKPTEPNPLDASVQKPLEEPSKAPFILLGGAGALAVAGGVFGLMSHSASSAADTERVQIAASADNDSAHSRALVANVLFGAAAATAIAGGVWLLQR